METYKGKINEFVDWTTGIDERTEQVISGVSNNTKISGQSIRELVLSHLKKPFVTREDSVAGVIRVFSGEEIAEEWWKYANPNKDNLYYDIEKAGEIINKYLIWEIELPATYRITGLDGFVATRYIIDGNTSSQNSILDINLGLEDAMGSTEFDVMTVSYIITDSSDTVRYSSSDQIETGLHVEKQIYLYLRSGENKISITVSSNNHNAKTTKVFSIFLVTFTILSNFTGYYNPVANGVPFSFDVVIQRSITNLPVITTVYIDGNVAKLADNDRSEAIWRYGESSPNPSRRIEIYNQYSSSDYENKNKHLLKIESKMEDPETGTAFYSNILVYEFEVAPTSDDLIYSYVNLAASIPSGSYGETIVEWEGKTRVLPILKTTLYLQSSINWGYNTDSYSQLLLTQVLWSIRKGLPGNYIYTTLTELLGIKGTKPDPLDFIPGEPLTYDEDNSFLVASIINNGVPTEVAIYPISVAESNINIFELGNYSLKLTCVGKTNSSENKNQWVDEENNVHTTFSSGVLFDDSNGWNNNSLILKGIDSFATIGYCPFLSSSDSGRKYSVKSDGATFEIDFKPEYIANEGDVLIRIGNVNSPHIDICTDNATVIIDNAPVVKTNYKSGERIKLAFIFNRYSEISNSSNLVYIVNNGILERAASMGSTPLEDNESNIRIGGSNSSVRIYQIRAYRYDLSPKLELNNYMFDNISNIDLISRNDIYGDSSEVTYGGMSGKQDIIVIEGDLTNILKNKSSKLNATVDIKRESNIDPDRNFIVTNCRVRNHGLSTLSYPITSMKIWFNKSNKLVELVGENGSTSLIEVIPNFNCQQLNYLGLNKNRYIMKEGAIPANKFVLQANYADSSGTHNGSLLRLILDTWYNALFGDDRQFKLRTAPLLFASGSRITHDNQSLNEDGSWIEGVYNVPPSDENNYNEDWANKTWPEISNQEFPYKIRNAADSFPCVVFYKDTSNNQLNLSLLGLYVFMDDKKSDFVFGERSIYYTNDTTDPFCLKVENSKKDKNSNKVWDNDKVLQIEVVYLNSPLTSYVSKYVASSYTIDENDNLIPGENAVLTRFDEVTARDSSGKPTEYQWELHFELIYPDKEDIKDNNNRFDADKFAATVLPFEDFLNWITDVAELRNTGEKLGLSGSKSHVTLAELNKFINEAHDHLDLYKLAAYYVFFLRFGLVDSVERNAQLKTYDGLHWHYEPWDMDIALGCANSGVIAYEPPLTRDSQKDSGGYVFSGRTTTQSNTLWDCLESWDYWAETIVPEVASALYDAGLTYDNAIKMFDKQYQEKWSETLYNESGQYKYIEATLESRYRLYLNGARTSHRHWWLSKSMNYYDAKWECGDFKKYQIVTVIDKLGNPSGVNTIKLYPISNTFFKLVYGAEGNEVSMGGGLTSASVENPSIIDVHEEIDSKNPLRLLGANNIRRVDFSGLLDSSYNLSTTSVTSVDLHLSYDPVLGALIRELILGAPTTPNIYEYPNATSYISNLTVGQNSIVGAQDGYDALENLELLDVTGWWTKALGGNTGSWLSSLMEGRKNISTLYAMGCNMATEFATSLAGNKFVDLRLPNSIKTLTLTNSSWENLSFWNATSINVTKARYDKVSVPASINNITLGGTTAKNECSLRLVLDWIDAIEATLPVSHTEEDLYEVLKTKTLIANQIHWGTGSVHLTFNDVLRLAHFGGVSSLKGYVLITAGQGGINSSQLTLLQNLFGENVFNIGTTNSNLVIDYSSDAVIISISGIQEKLQIDEHIYIKEPNSAILSANHFTLTSGSSNNLVVDLENNNPNINDSFTENKYIWGFVSSLSAPLGSSMSATLPHARLERGNDGIVRLRTEEGDGNDYTLYIRVMYGKLEEGQIRIMMDTIAVNVIAVTYPSDYNWQITGSSLTQFRYNSTIAQSLFGQLLQLTLDNSPIYVFRSPSLAAEFSLKPAENKYYFDQSGQRQENWTANEANEHVEYHISELGNVSMSSINAFSGYKNRTEFQTTENKIFDIGTSTYVWATDNSTNGGIPIKVTNILPSNMILYCVRGRVLIGGLNPINKAVYFIIINDPTPILYGSLSPLSSVMWGAYCNLYSISTLSNLNMYKTDLMSLYGTIDFSTEPTIESLISDASDTILNYLPYVSGLDFEGCSVLVPTDPISFANNFVFNTLLNLTSLSLKGCAGLNSYTLDLSSCTELTSLNTQGSNVGIILPMGTKISSMALGSPTQISINSPVSLDPDNVTILSSSNLTSISLGNIQMVDNFNNTYLKGYMLFNKIYNPS